MFCPGRFQAAFRASNHLTCARMSNNYNFRSVHVVYVDNILCLIFDIIKLKFDNMCFVRLTF